MKIIYTAAVALFGLSLSVSAQDDGKIDVAATLKGNLIEAKDGKVAEAELKGDPEYYVLYHSASW
ncbi:MAG: hypothetical protein HKN23_15385 [Verrucomicrobiales bacterium]|nr:hypothetical protein [Verrucomicrobiales bacterium]